MHQMNLRPTLPIIALFGALCLSLTLLLPAPAAAECVGHETTTASLEEWETDVLGLRTACAAPNTEVRADDDDGFMDEAIEEWETDVLGMRLFCAAVDAAFMSLNPGDDPDWGELAVLQIGCFDQHLEAFDHHTMTRDNDANPI